LSKSFWESVITQKPLDLLKRFLNILVLLNTFSARLIGGMKMMMI